MIKKSYKSAFPHCGCFFFLIGLGDLGTKIGEHNGK